MGNLFEVLPSQDSINIEKCDNGYIVRVYKKLRQFPPHELLNMKAMAKIMPEVTKQCAIGADQGIDETVDSWKPKKKNKNIDKIIDEAYAPILNDYNHSAGPKIYVFIDKQKLLLFLSSEIDSQ